MEESEKKYPVLIEKAAQVLIENGEELSRFEIEKMLKIMNRLAKIAINQYFRESNNA